jgi:hypothetical protein
MSVTWQALLAVDVGPERADFLPCVGGHSQSWWMSRRGCARRFTRGTAGRILQPAASTTGRETAGGTQSLMTESPRPSPAFPLCACGGSRVAAGIQTEDAEKQSIWLWRPTRRGWGTRNVTRIRALACVDCGLVTLHVSDLNHFRADVDEHPGLYRWE